MKKIFIFCLFTMLLSGCTSSINTVDKETYLALNKGSDLLDEYEKYINEDSSKSIRTKETIKTKIKYVKEAIKLIKVKE